MTEALSPAALRIIDWLGDVGSRWGLPPMACRVHGLLYLRASPHPIEAIAATLGVERDAVTEALRWLTDHKLAAQSAHGWQTRSDPWELVMQSLDARRAREIGEARSVRDAWQQHDRAAEEPVVVRQAEKLFALVDDIAAIEATARHLPSAAARGLVRLGGTAARFFERAGRFGGTR